MCTPLVSCFGKFARVSSRGARRQTAEVEIERLWEGESLPLEMDAKDGPILEIGRQLLNADWKQHLSMPAVYPYQFIDALLTALAI